MKYSSTRGEVNGLTFEEALFMGYASDGGLLLPDDIPKLSAETLKQWSSLSYTDLVKNISSLFISENEIPRKDLEGIIDRAFSRFQIPEILRIARLKNGLNILEMFHGTTMAFKDLALSCVGQFLAYFLEKRKQHLTILVGTSGDTGSAAIEAVQGSPWMDIIVLLPRGRCTQIQELQMTTVVEDNVHVFRVDGTSDDLDFPIKKCFTDKEFAATNKLSCINSVNWGRILVQMGHYFFSYFQMAQSEGEVVEMVIPTGACGNVTSGVIACQMGLPVKFTCAVNVNDIFARTIKKGDFSMAPTVTQTLASAMDIQVPYNMERLLCLFGDRDTTLVRHLQEEMEAKGKVVVPDHIHKKLSSVISSYVVDNSGIQWAMKRCWEENDYVMCPHTAVAANYHYNNSCSHPRICFATASPAKFPEAVESAGLTPQPTSAITALFSKPTRYEEMERGQDWEAMLRNKIQTITQKCTKA